MADRFHLLENLVDALEKAFKEYPRELKAVETTIVQRSQQEALPGVELAIIPPPTPEPSDLLNAQQSRAMRLDKYEQTWELHEAGIRLANFITPSQREPFVAISNKRPSLSVNRTKGGEKACSTLTNPIC